MNKENLDVEAPKSDYPNGKMSATIPEFTSKISSKEQLSNNTLEMKDDYNTITNKFLEICRKDSISKEDQQMILKALGLVKDVPRMLLLIDDCYKLKNELDLRPGSGSSGGKSSGIWSFKYIYNYIVKEMESNDERRFNGQGSASVLERETNASEEILGQSNFDSVNGRWEANLECDF